ncbi:MAG: N-acetylmuramoyl-L-alanine amidase [Cytophagales bacterium]|nr:N-acetylmuramoyl-L-alanine amidase [Cytophagales bacterium]
MIKKALLIGMLVASLSLNAQELKRATPLSGEGIYGFLERNGVDRKFKTEFVKLNASRLGANESLLKDVSYQINPQWVVVPKEEWRVYPIFGKEHERLKILSNELEGSVFYLVSGHGGPDPGAVAERTNGDLCEDEYAYDVTLRLARWLIQRNALVYFIVRDDNDGIRDGPYLPCDKDEYAYTRGSIPRSQVKRLEQRSDIINSLYRKHRGSKYQRMVVIHVDSRATNENVDVFFYHYPSSRRGKKLADDILKTFDRNYKEFQPNRTYRGSVKPRSSLFVLKNTSPAAVFIELGNIVNSKDQRRILIDDNREALAKWIGEGLMKNFKER